ncbi:MAG: ATP-binding cassette domain-containing protein [Candidatus Heimdallarchaeum endolithica]|uniref:ATP-binding cassette domain-containing protein n=1 Tax=Candidatus Heimdallarchaeum endolithica TaxID=2876572 RepID=A0A9Y1BRM0_9ARCH|nr:MAG: ATP-binding cassette domain-containing protein [Candidatus Heimdallarchaeum endolithica]
MSNPILETVNLTLKIEDKLIFRNINLKVEKGTIHALIGVNGCGKSSIASVLMGLKKPTKGKIILDGENIVDLSITERAQKGLTLAWQEPVRFEGLSVKDYLSISGKSVNIDTIKKALESVGLIPEKYLDRFVDDTLSGGERKRVELASILLMKPKVAILDEIDSGVDFIGIDKVLDTIRKIAQSGSVLLITHQDEFLKITDKATLICNGIILRTGEPQGISKFYRYECTYCVDENPDFDLEELLNVNR